MYLTEKEIQNEFLSIRRCLDYVSEQENGIRSLFRGKKRVWVVGSGSSYYLAKSAASMLTMRCGIPSFALTAGELLLHTERYRRAMEGSILLFITRSGQTSEVLQGREAVLDVPGINMAVLTANQESVLNRACGFSLCVPWAFDESVCQTRTIGSFYACISMITALLSGDGRLKRELYLACSQEEKLREKILLAAGKVAAWNWERGIVLADSEASGVMEEGALAFKEICCTDSNFYQVLDVRHGPMVMIEGNSLVFLLLEQNGAIEETLVRDLGEKTGNLVTFGPFEKREPLGLHFQVEELQDPIAYAVLALYFLQNVTLQRALRRGINPDRPRGLDPWIKL